MGDWMSIVGRVCVGVCVFKVCVLDVCLCICDLLFMTPRIRWPFSSPHRGYYITFYLICEIAPGVRSFAVLGSRRSRRLHRWIATSRRVCVCVFCLCVRV